MSRDAFGRPALWVGDLQFVWYGWRRWRPLVAFYRIAPSNPMSEVWIWEAFVGPVAVRRWVPVERVLRGTGKDAR